MELIDRKVNCTMCKNTISELAVFPGGICLDCYRPIGNALHRTMTADKLTTMWGGK